MYEQSYTFTFEAAHELARAVNETPSPDAAHPYARLHGHSFAATVTLRAETVSEAGWIVDFAALRAACAAVKDQLDHRLLNDVPGLGAPTLERLAAWIHGELAKTLSGVYRVDVERPTLKERVSYYNSERA